MKDQQGVFYLAHQFGIASIYAACRSSNPRAKKSIEKGGFTWVGTYEKFASFHGEEDSVELHTLYLEDAAAIPGRHLIY